MVIQLWECALLPNWQRSIVYNHIISSNDGGESPGKRQALCVLRKLASFGLFVLTTESVNSFEHCRIT